MQCLAAVSLSDGSRTEFGKEAAKILEVTRVESNEPVLGLDGLRPFLVHRAGQILRSQGLPGGSLETANEDKPSALGVVAASCCRKPHSRTIPQASKRDWRRLVRRFLCELSDIPGQGVAQAVLDGVGRLKSQ